MRNIVFSIKNIIVLLISSVLMVGLIILTVGLFGIKPRFLILLTDLCIIALVIFPAIYKLSKSEKMTKKRSLIMHSNLLSAQDEIKALLDSAYSIRNEEERKEAIKSIKSLEKSVQDSIERLNK